MNIQNDNNYVVTSKNLVASTSLMTVLIELAKRTVFNSQVTSLEGKNAPALTEAEIEEIAFSTFKKITEEREMR